LTYAYIEADARAAFALPDPGLLERIGQDSYKLASELFPICRSITGNGVRETLDILAHYIPLEVSEVPSGTQVFDWTVPREWTIRDAYIKDEAGVRVVDFQAHSLHVMGYSVPVHERLPLSELKAHIHTLPDQPDLIPYRTSYYAEDWAFCMAYNALNALPDGMYEVKIDASLDNGYLTYGEFLHRGEIEDEFLLSANICHPSMANDNCSGLALLALLAGYLSQCRTRLSYRFLFTPATIGAIVWLARNEANAGRIKHGLTVSCVGDGGGPTYKKSRRGNALIDRAMAHVLKHAAHEPNILEFFPYGYDERQYCSPGFNLPVGMFQRSRFAAFPEYHTSADNLDFIRAEHLAESFEMVLKAIEIAEFNACYLNLSPKCEPQLGKRGLYGSVGGDTGVAERNLAMLWVLNLSDGEYSLLDIAERANMPFSTILATAQLLEAHGLLAPAPDQPESSRE
jgi:aminopeptidase-like protein